VGGGAAVEGRGQCGGGGGEEEAEDTLQNFVSFGLYYAQPLGYERRTNYVR